ncbi:DUF2207 domain-containing protein, partial [Candidatus Bathyarchaeota archaeon]|nr:DUF2207 domain-containing protein [Candidatus Bathyarchaeota archaeon]
LAYRSEVGAFNPGYYDPGTYRVVYVYVVRPPLEYDSTHIHLNLKLASEHIPYRNAQVTLVDPGYIDNVYPHPPNLVRKENSVEMTFSGSLAADELLELEMLINEDHEFSGFMTPVEDVRKKTEDANLWYSLQYTVAVGVLWLNRLLGFGVPVLFLYIYRRHGREREHTVPTYLSTVPNDGRKPWLVNLVFKNDARDYDEDGLYATLLDLHERKKISIEMTGEEDFVVTVLDRDGLDRYESRVVEYMDDLGVKGVVNTEYLRGLAEVVRQDPEIARRVVDLQMDYGRLTSGPSKAVADEFTYNGRPRILPFLGASMVLFFASILFLVTTENATGILMEAVFYGAIPVIQCIIAFTFPSTLFGRWKEDAYREKLEWDSFMRHLSDFSQLQRYETEDLNMWGRWLVYGTAMGVGEKVAEAMQRLNLPYAPARFAP